MFVPDYNVVPLARHACGHVAPLPDRPPPPPQGPHLLPPLPALPLIHALLA